MRKPIGENGVRTTDSPMMAPSIDVQPAFVASDGEPHAAAEHSLPRGASDVVIGTHW
jgi:hypothetical protein